MPTLNNTETTHPDKNIQSIADNLVLVEGGSFMMGSEKGEKGSCDDEHPLHEVRLSAYHISKYPVTQAQWQAVMGNNPSHFKEALTMVRLMSMMHNQSHFKGDTRPVENVSWEDCQEFIKKLNQLTGKQYRLPTEAEWEYAARGGNKSRGYTYSGSDNLDEVGWYDENSGDETHAVGQKKPNELGLYDMSGNVWEWCNDWYDSDYYGKSPTSNPQGASSGSSRVNRGGSLRNDAQNCRSVLRYDDTPSSRYGNLGFRLVSDNIDLEVLKSIADNLVLVEGGSFNMGSEDGEDWERPVHEVRLSAYHISKYPVTQAQWQAVMGNNPSNFKGDARPVEQVSWEDCQLFIKKLNKFTGKQYRLPTEAEWEYAARGGNKSRGYTYSGSNNLDEVGWYDSNSAGLETHAVGQKKPNELGLYDVSGNVWEWCNDWYDEDYYGQSPSSNPQGPSSGSGRVCRGGGFCNLPEDCHSAYRISCMPSDLGFGLGFRLVSHIVDIATIIQSIADNLVLVEGGSFNMGSEDGEDWERPVHKVRLSAYYISKYPVTQAQWQAVMGNNPSEFKGDTRPVEKVSWEDCQEFIGKLNRLTGKEYRLPTEAEWERAARGGNKSRGYTYSGSNNLDAVGWYCDNSGGEPHAVGQKRANELGLYDMSGNVWEWCNDWYGSNYYDQSPSSNPQGASSGSGRVLRGGCWYDDAPDCRFAYRFRRTPSDRSSRIGFRLVSQ
jgi:formylglycine-generating enzyme required for sulfatase activity